MKKTAFRRGARKPSLRLTFDFLKVVARYGAFCGSRIRGRDPMLRRLDIKYGKAMAMLALFKKNYVTTEFV